MLETIIGYLDSDDYKEELLDMVKDNADGNFYFDERITGFLSQFVDVSSLSEEDYNVLLKVIRKNIDDRTDAYIRINSEVEHQIKETSEFWREQERSLYGSDYYKPVSENYREYLEERMVK